MEDKDNRTANLYVVGTDTDVGKSVLSLLLMQFFYAKGATPFYIKSLQTGCGNARDKDSDAGFIYRNIDALKGKDPAGSVTYCFKNPKAPYFAARNEGKKIDLKVIQEFVDIKSRIFSPVILEAAGGLLVPINEEVLMIDLIKIMGLRPVIAARAGLGTINHTLLTIEAMERRGIKPAGVVFLDPGETEISRELIDENIEAVERFSGIRVAGIIGKIRDFSRPGKECMEVIERLVLD